MGAYRFHDFVLDVAPDELETRARLPRLWSDLSWEKAEDPDDPRFRSLTMRIHARGGQVPAAATPLFATSTFNGFQLDQEFYFSDGQSFLRIRPLHLDAEACLAPSFFAAPLLQQYTFWSFALAMLLRAADRYVLHAAGLVHTSSDVAMLVAGPSGSGKTTLALAAIRLGWHYVSDDAVLLASTSMDSMREPSLSISALGMRRHCYVDSDAAGRYSDFEFGAAVPDRNGHTRRRVIMPDESDTRRLPECQPRVLLFPSITQRPSTELVPIAPLAAFKLLLDASGNQLLCDRRSMPNHARVLAALVRQSRAFELRAGLDVFHDPSMLFDRLCDAALSEDACRVC